MAISVHGAAASDAQAKDAAFATCSLLLEGSKQPDAARWIATRADLDRLAALLSGLAPKRPLR